jgi:hypothetical protein
MRPRSKTLLLAAILAVVSAFATSANPRSINDCEKISDGDAYNKCLASYGPKRGQRARGKALGPETGKAYKTHRGTKRRNGRSGIRSGSIGGIRIYRSRGRIQTVIPVRRGQR